jgi:ArsR family transcriptional regulator, lead/cadmium/zinc/bismuth-responsive transcriptional repressor
VAKPVMARQTTVRQQRVDDDLCSIQCIDAHKVTAARKAAQNPGIVQTATDIFRVLGDPTRLRIVNALTRHELCVCDLALIVNASQSTVSHSLRALRQLRLVKYRKEGKIAFYSLDDHHIAALLKTAFEHAAES